MEKNYQHEIIKTTPPFQVQIGSWNKFSGRYYIAPHWHRAIEVNFVQSGSTQDFQIMNKHYQLGVSKIIVVNSREIHSVRATMGKQDKGIVILYPYPYVMDLFPKIRDYQIEINDPQQFDDLQALKYADLQAALAKLNICYNQHDPDKRLEIAILIPQILALILKYFVVKRKLSDVDVKKEYQIERLLYLTQFINDNYQQKLALTDLAQKCGITKQYLTRFFKKLVGMTVGEYISNVRAQHVYHGLYRQEENLTELALNNGFSGVRTMNRAMKKVYGQTASEIYKSIH